MPGLPTQMPEAPKEYPLITAEEWLGVLFESRPADAFGTTFRKAVRFAAARLTDVPGGRNSPYYYGITTPIDTNDHQKIQAKYHLEFWRRVRSAFSVKTIVTMNYDILAEQALKAKSTGHRSAPVCHYGGMPTIQTVRTYTNIQKNKFRETRLGSELALYKMHGSLNWSLDTNGFEIRDHLGAAFRADDRLGELAIIPPVRNKEPEWLSLVWRYAKAGLRGAPIWIVCGYSLPPYDESLRDFFAQAARAQKNLRIGILDPLSQSVATRWKELAPSARVVLSPGLPDALEDANWQRLVTELS